MTKDISAQRLAYLHIRDAIVGGYMPAGAKLRPEAIAELLGISRMPVRDAIYQLDAEGFIQLIANRGATVRGYSGAEIIDLSEMRALLEGFAARLAVEVITTEDIAKLEYLLDRARRCENDYRKFLERHDEFHLYLYELSGRPHLLEEITWLRLLHRPYLLAYCLGNDEQEMLGFEHDLILDELRRRDADGVDRTVRAHVIRNAENISAFLGSKSASTGKATPKKPSSFGAQQTTVI
jgi:DNA-binding GntR family transcriptional regulator